MAGAWVQCPHCRLGRPLRFNIVNGDQAEGCPQCHGSFLLRIRGRRLHGVVALAATTSSETQSAPLATDLMDEQRRDAATGGEPEIHASPSQPEVQLAQQVGQKASRCESGRSAAPATEEAPVGGDIGVLALVQLLLAREDDARASVDPDHRRMVEWIVEPWK